MKLKVKMIFCSEFVTFFYQRLSSAQDLPSLVLGKNDEAADCTRLLCIRDSSSNNSTFPWLINNKNARFN